jgi:hypothetical protein
MALFDEQRDVFTAKSGREANGTLGTSSRLVLKGIFSLPVL